MTERDVPNSSLWRRRPAFPEPRSSATPPGGGSERRRLRVRLPLPGTRHFVMGRPPIVPRSGRSLIRLIPEASSPSDDRPDEGANQRADRQADHGHHSDRVEMTPRGSAARYGPVHTQGEKQTSTHRPADHGPPSSVLQDACLQEGTIKTGVHLHLRGNKHVEGHLEDEHRVLGDDSVPTRAIP